MLKITFKFLVFGLYFSNLIAQTNLGDDEIAKVGWLSISSDEFLERIEMTPQFNRQRDKSNESLKLEFLYTLIAEKLWALEAENMNLDSTTAIKTALSSIEKLYVRDALFNEEVKNKIKVTEDMYIDGVIKNSKVFYVKYLFSDEYSKITLVDLRYINSVYFQKFIQVKENSDVLFMYNTSILNNSSIITKFLPN